MSVSVCRDLSQWGGLSSWRQSKLLPAEAGMPEGGGQRGLRGDHQSDHDGSSTEKFFKLVKC